MFDKEIKKLQDKWSVLQDLEGLDIFVAGGAITSIMTNKEINDIDLYFKDEKAFTEFIGLWLSGDLGFLSVLSVTDKSITFLSTTEKVVIQTIFYRWFEDAEDIFKDFDFTINMGAYSLKDKSIKLHEDFLKHNSQRYLSVNTGTAFPIISALRVDKYKKRGYTISKPQYFRILLPLVKLNINSWQEFKNHIGGMYGSKVEDLFDTSKDFSLEEALDQIDNNESEYSEEDPTVYDYEVLKVLLKKVTPKCKEVLEEYRGCIYSWRVGNKIMESLGEDGSVLWK